MSDGIEFVIEYLDDQHSCHDDCMCDLCIAKQQAWEAQVRIGKLEAELNKCTALLEKHWLASMSCNGILQVAGHLENVFKEIASLQWISVEDDLPKESGMYQVVRETNRYPTTREYCHESLMWVSRDIITHWKPIIIPEPPTPITNKD